MVELILSLSGWHSVRLATQLCPHCILWFMKMHTETPPIIDSWSYKK